MSYRILSRSLWPVSDAVSKYLQQNRGLGSPKVEEEVAEGLPRPTLHVKTKDQDFLCVEVLEDSCYSDNIDRFISKAKAMQLPIRLFVAYPEGSQSPAFSKNLKQAREQGIGVLSVSSSGQVTPLGEPISQILAGVQRIDPGSFPKAYRADLAQAEQTYLQGNPPKGCLGIYEKIETLGRKVAKKLHATGLIASWATGNPPKFDKAPFFNIADTIYKELDFASAPDLTKTTWAEVIAMTKPRNEVGHEPKTTAARVKRDKEMRTRFENAVIVLRHLIEETRKMNL
jgi:hypothetical protein